MKIRDDVLDAIGEKGSRYAHTLWLDVMRQVTGGDKNEMAKHLDGVGDVINEALAAFAYAVIETVEFYGWESIVEDE